MEKVLLMSFANFVRRRSPGGVKFCDKREWLVPSEPRRPKMPVTAEIQSVDDKSAVSLTTQAYETLRQDILAGVLPPGKKLRIEELKETYGIGASAIREALSMLISDILVQRIDHRGFRVAEVSLSTFHGKRLSCSRISICRASIKPIRTIDFSRTTFGRSVINLCIKR